MTTITMFSVDTYICPQEKLRELQRVEVAQVATDCKKERLLRRSLLSFEALFSLRPEATRFLGSKHFRRALY